MAIVRGPSLTPIGAIWTGYDLVALAPYGASALSVLWCHQLAWELSAFHAFSSGAGFIFWQEKLCAQQFRNLRSLFACPQLQLRWTSQRAHRCCWSNFGSLIPLQLRLYSSPEYLDSVQLSPFHFAHFILLRNYVCLVFLAFPWTLQIHDSDQFVPRVDETLQKWPFSSVIFHSIYFT